MIFIPFVLSPNVFNFEGLSQTDVEDRLFQLKMLDKIISIKGIMLIDSQGFIKNEIKGFVESIENDNIKKAVITLISKLFNNSIFEVDINELDFQIMQYCKYFFSLISTNPKAIAIYGIPDCSELKNCQKCYKENTMDSKELYSITEIKTDKFLQFFDVTSIASINDYDIEKLKKDILENISKYSKELFIFDNQLIPDIEKQNRKDEKFKIARNYEKNLEYWLEYFNTINQKLKISIFLSIKINQNQILDDIINSFVKFKQDLRRKYPYINLELRTIEENKRTESIVITPHQRYFIFDKIAFSCDRGIDLINFSRTKELRDFNISLLSQKDRTDVFNYLCNNSKIIN